MKKATRFAVTLVLFVLSVTAQAAPKIACDAPVFDWGQLPDTEQAKAMFELRNEGDEPLEITDTRASCGCTKPTLSQKTLAPGESTPMEATVNLRGRSGRQSKTVWVTSNDPVKPTLTLTINGMVESTGSPAAGHAAGQTASRSVGAVSILPDKLAFGSVAPGATPELKVNLSSSKGPFEITEITNPAENVEVRVEKVGDGKSQQLFAKLKEGTPLGRIASTISLKTSIPESPVLAIPVTAFVVEQIGVVPQSIEIPKDGTGPITRYLAVVPGQVKTFKVLEVDPPSPDIKTRIYQLGNAGYRIQLSNLASGPSLVGQKLRIKTDVEAMPMIEVPFVGQF